MSKEQKKSPDEMLRRFQSRDEERQLSRLRELGILGATEVLKPMPQKEFDAKVSALLRRYAPDTAIDHPAATVSPK